MSAPRRPAVCAASLAVLSALGVLQVAGGAPAASAAPAITAPTVSASLSRTVLATGDAYTDSSSPTRVTGESAKLAVGTSDRTVKTGFLTFQVPAAPRGLTLSGARLVLQVERAGSPEVTLRTAAASGWTESTVSAADRPATGGVVATVPLTGTTKAATFDVTEVVQSTRTEAFALTATRGVSSFASSESGTRSPRLLLTYRSAPATPPTPPTPPAPPAPPAPPSAKGGTLFGMSIAPRSGEGAAGAVDRLRGQFGGMPVARVFDSGMVPARWSDDATLRALGTGSAVVYSFKGNMAALAAGKHDEQIRAFLRSRPAGVKVWVALHHEPEDDVERGAFTPAQFRAATAHVAPVIKSAGGIPTTILMQYTLGRSSGRDWRDYYTPAIDVMAWDGYNSMVKKSVQGYKAPQDFVAPVLAVAKETGKGFGWAELGSPCVAGDASCTGRAAWLAGLSGAMKGAGAQFATYWNRPALTGTADYSLSDAGSVRAWRTAMTP